MSCQTGCWALAAGVGLLACILLLVIGGYGWVAAIFIGGLLFLVLGFLFSWIFCSPMTSAGSAATSGGAAKPAAAPAAAPAPAP
ncbi:endonuclease, partial [Litorisediminicola beolgyonensis]